MDALIPPAYGLLLLGALLEGEVSVMVGGAMAEQGRMQLPAVVVVAAAAAWANDLVCFSLGRWRGSALLQRWPTLQRHTGGVRCWVERYPALAALAVRFTYGLRMAGPMLIGCSRLGVLHFAAVSAVGALAWGLLVASLGWCFGTAAHALFLRHGWAVLWLLPLAAVLLLGMRQWALRRRRD